jgi:hypothetical protein
MSTKELPLDDPRFIKFMSGCPVRWQGDHGFLQWLTALYDLGAAGGFPALPAPVVEALVPDTGPANADITLGITGTDFDSLCTVNIGSAFGLVPSSVTPTELSVLVEAVNIAQAGTLGVSVENPDGQVSNALDFTALDSGKTAGAAGEEDKPERSRDEHGRFN